MNVTTSIHSHNASLTAARSVDDVQGLSIQHMLPTLLLGYPYFVFIAPIKALLLAAELGAAGLGVKVLVAVNLSVMLPDILQLPSSKTYRSAAHSTM